MFNTGQQNQASGQIEMKYARLEEDIRTQFARQHQQLQEEQKEAVKRLAQARNECNMGNPSSCQMVPSLKAEVERFDQERQRVTEDEQRMLLDLTDRKKEEIKRSQPTYLGVTDWGTVGMSTPGSQDALPASGASYNIDRYTNQGKVG